MGRWTKYVYPQTERQTTGQNKKCGPQNRLRTWSQTSWFTAALIALAVGLRLCQINNPLWYDEAFSAWLAALPIPQLIAATAADVHPPAYYLLLWAITHTLGNAEWLLRLPSMLAGLALIPVVWRLGTALDIPSPIPAIAAALTAFSPWQIYYSNEARSYQLLTLAVALAAMCLIERKYWLAGIATLGALYLHNLAPLFVVALWLAAWSHSKRYYVAGCVTAVLYIPGLLWTITQILHVYNGYWIPPLSAGRIIAAFDDLLFFAPNSPFIFASALLTGLALVLIACDSPASHNRFLLLAAGLPVAALALISLWTPLFQSRSIAPVAPFYYLLLAAAISRTPRRLVTFAGMGLPVLACTLIAYGLGYVGRDAPDHDTARLLAGADAIYHANVGSYVVWHYYLPDTPQFLYPQPTTLAQTLTTETRLAMGMKEDGFDFIKCMRYDGQDLRRWALIYFHNPTTAPTEIEMVARLYQTNHGQKTKMLRSDSTVEAWLVTLTPDCEDHYVTDMDGRN